MKKIAGFILTTVFLIGLYDFTHAQRGLVLSSKAIRALGSLIDESGNLVFPSSGIALYDSDSSNTISLVWNENDSSDRILNLLVNSLSRTINLGGNLTLANNLTTIGNFALTLTLTGTTSLTLPTSGTLFTTAGGTILGPLTVGVDDAGHDFKAFGATSGKYSLWDESENKQYIVGAFEAGDLTNYTRISSAGAVSYAGSAKPTECVFLRTAEAYLPDGTPAAATLVTVDGTSPHAVLDFSAAADNNAYWDFQVPAGYDAGNVSVEVYWFSAAAVAGNAQFDIDYRSVGNSGAVDGAATDVAMTLQTTDGTAGDLNTTTGTLTTPFTAGALVRFGLRRDISEEGGTPLVGNARVRGCKICWSRAS